MKDIFQNNCSLGNSGYMPLGAFVAHSRVVLPVKGGTLPESPLCGSSETLIEMVSYR
jgi:glutaredoxin-related protein